MNLENSIKDVISKKLEDGSIEQAIETQLEKGINNALEGLFRSYGDITKLIEEKIKSIMVPYLESYDYSQYITKLDAVLVEVLKSSCSDHKNLLENFKDLMTVQDKQSHIKLSTLFEKWVKYVEEHVETDGLEINYDDEPTYESVEVTLEVREEERPSWSSFENATILFECEHDEKMNFAVRVSHWKDSSNKNWDIHYQGVHSISSLRHLNSFEILLMNLSQNGVKIEIDTNYEEEWVKPESKPEPDWR